MSNIINWFEIPVVDLERAVKFYENVFQTTLSREDMSDVQMAAFPYEKQHVSGALVKYEHYKPSADGVVIYMQTAQLDATLERITSLGGQCIFGPMVLPDCIGTIALFIDCEGNRVGLHQPA